MIYCGSIYFNTWNGIFDKLVPSTIQKVQATPKWRQINTPHCRGTAIRGAKRNKSDWIPAVNLLHLFICHMMLLVVMVSKEMWECRYQFGIWADTKRRNVLLCFRLCICDIHSQTNGPVGYQVHAPVPDHGGKLCCVTTLPLVQYEHMFILLFVFRAAHRPSWWSSQTLRRTRSRSAWPCSCSSRCSSSVLRPCGGTWQDWAVWGHSILQWVCVHRTSMKSLFSSAVISTQHVVCHRSSWL